jgi:hypothetical protein
MVYVHKVEERSVVEPQFCRNEEFTPFAFYITEEGLPEECDMPTLATSTDDECVMMMRNYYPYGVERAVLINRFVEEGMSENAAKVRVCRAIKRGLLVVNNKIVSLPNTS